jgi:hypothetical protein
MHTVLADTRPRTEPAPPGKRADRPAPPRSRRSALAAALRAGVAEHWRLAGTVLLLAIVSWPYRDLAPIGIDDANWMFSLELAARQGIDYGSQFDWTYGPLGFLLLKPTFFYSDTALLRFAAQWLLQLALAGSVYWAARRSWSPLVAFALAAVAIVLTPERQVTLALTLCVLALLRGEDRDRLARAFPVAIGALAGFMLLDKINGGVEAVALAVVTLAARPQRRRVDAAAFAGALATTVLAAWLATGQQLGDLPAYVRYGVEVVAGYAGAMGIVDPTGGWHYVAAAALMVAVTTLALGAVRNRDARLRWGLALLLAVYAFMAFKAGFVRHDGHAATFMAAMLVAALVLPVPRVQRPFALVTMALAVVAYAGVIPGFSLTRAVDPYANAKALAKEVRTFAVKDRRGAQKGRLRQELQASAQLPPPVLAELADHSVAFWPHSLAMIAYAYDIDWRPLPVVESYAVYTPALDRLNAGMLASARAPERMVRTTLPAIDGRNATFEAPETTLRILCDYREVMRAGPYQVLAHSPSRCGRPRPLAFVEAPWGAPVRVPVADAGHALIVRIDGTEPSGLERLKALLLRPEARRIQLDDASYRLIDATAGGGLLLDIPSGADYVAPFRMATSPATIAVRRDGDQPGGTLRYAFEQIPIEPLSAAR